MQTVIEIYIFIYYKDKTYIERENKYTKMSKFKDSERKVLSESFL